MLNWTVRITTFVMLLAVGIYAVGALVLPDEKRVSRSIDVAASEAAVFNVVNDMRAFNRWSPWAELDPNTRYEYQGPRQGVGAAMSWTSQSPQVGSGSQLIVASEPNDLVRLRLQFGADQTAMAELELASSPNGGTRVTWHLDMDFDGDILQRYVGAFVLEGAIGRDYERGLTNLKNLLERGS
ncbi:MAG: SRPBCC family protein [Pseudomonadota bacterium]